MSWTRRFGTESYSLALEPEQKIVENKVLLRSCTFSSDIVVGTVIAAKMDCDSTTTVRYTTNEWEMYAVITTNYCGNEKRSIFEIDMEEKTHLRFAVCLHVNNMENWDNNDCKNYSLVLVPILRV